MDEPDFFVFLVRFIVWAAKGERKSRDEGEVGYKRKNNGEDKLTNRG